MDASQDRNQFRKNYSTLLRRAILRRTHTVLTDALYLADSVISHCQPWRTEFERRGLAAIRRRMHHDIKLQFE